MDARAKRSHRKAVLLLWHDISVTEKFLIEQRNWVKNAALLKMLNQS